MWCENTEIEIRKGTIPRPFGIGLKYNLGQSFIVIHSTNQNNANKCLSVKKETKQQRRDFNSHQVTLPDSQYSSQTGNAIVFKGTKCCPEERLTYSIILEHPQSCILFFFYTENSIKH